MQSKKLHGLALISVVGIVTFFVIGRNGGVLGDAPEVVVYDGTGKATLYIPFDRGADGALSVDAYVDEDNDGAFTPQERSVSSMPIYPDEGWRNGYAFSIRGGFSDEVKVKIMLSSGETFEGAANVRTYDTDALLGLEGVTDTNVMKGPESAPPVAPLREGTTDITQKFAECAPTAAANGIILLARQHGKKPADLPDQEDVIKGLKAEMDWTPERGVSPENFVAGKDAYMAKLGLPIRTTLAGGEDGRGTVQELRDALAEGKAAEVQIKFHDPNTGGGKGSHVVTVVGVEESDGKTLIKVNDPNTPAGTEIYDVSSGEVSDYPSKWSVTFGWGFVQTWEGMPTGAELDPLTDAEIGGIRDFVGEKEMIETIVYRSKHIPIAGLYVGKPHPKHATGEGCNQTHWHADGQVEAIEGGTFTDPDPGGCGFGRTSEVPVVSVEKP